MRVFDQAFLLLQVDFGVLCSASHDRCWPVPFASGIALLATRMFAWLGHVAERFIEWRAVAVSANRAPERRQLAPLGASIVSSSSLREVISSLR